MYDVAVYHCQQAAEKAFKAFLVQHGKPYEKTPDIEVLVDFAGDIDSNFSALADAADALTPYATRFRHPNATFALEPRPTEYDEALKYAQVLDCAPSSIRLSEDDAAEMARCGAGGDGFDAGPSHGSATGRSAIQ